MIRLAIHHLCSGGLSQTEIARVLSAQEPGVPVSERSVRRIL